MQRETDLRLLSTSLTVATLPAACPDHSDDLSASFRHAVLVSGVNLPLFMRTWSLWGGSTTLIKTSQSAKNSLGCFPSTYDQSDSAHVTY